MQLHRNFIKLFSFKYLNNFWLYTECVKLLKVARQLKSLRTPGI
jgi:hypothetical protein